MADSTALRYQFSELDDCSSKLSDVVASCENINSAVESITSQVYSVWEGPAKDAYTERSDQIITLLKGFKEIVEADREKLIAAVEVQRQNEDYLNTAVNNLSASDIF